MTAPLEVVQETTDDPIVIDGFGDDALGRVQGLLFGDHAQRTNARLESIEERLSEMIHELRASVDAQLLQLADQLNQETQTRDEAVSQIGTRVDQEVKDRTKAGNALGRKLEKANENLRGRIDQTADKASTELASMSEALAAEISVLQGDAVERTALAALLRSTANELDS